MFRLINATPIETMLLKLADVSDSKNPYKQIKISVYRRIYEMVCAAPTVNAVPANELPNVFRLGISVMGGNTVEVVRCKDCKFSDVWNERAVYCKKHTIGMNTNDFCSYGERKDEVRE